MSSQESRNKNRQHHQSNQTQVNLKQIMAEDEYSQTRAAQIKIVSADTSPMNPHRIQANDPQKFYKHNKV